MPLTAVLLVFLGAVPNVVLISVDTLRADRLGSYGYPRPTSPNLDRFAQESLVFDNCVCEVPLTGPSFGAIFTSLCPRMVGMTRNGLALPREVPTVTERFRDAGYYTFCVQSNWTLKAKLCGLECGFDVYDDGFHRRRWGVLKSERYADEVSDRALELLATRDPQRPFFAWIHYSDPHAPYRQHRDFDPSHDAFKGGDKIRRVNRSYDSEVAYTDYHVNRVLSALPTEDTYVVFLSDHGESLYEHNYLGHGRRVYQYEVRIPLMIRGPGIEPGRSDIPARGLDLAPTLSGLAGLTSLSGGLGLDLLHGVVARDRPRVIETYGGAVPKVPGMKALMAGRRPMRQAVLLEGWKLIVNGNETELYRLTDDPEELQDLAPREPDLAERLHRLITEWDQRIPRRHGEAAALSEEDFRALKSLGYLE
ncbi:MAG: sulfatase [Candidatus Hydrogenedentes bacterium]|nr:sulfatase [Candidatus Hydrogenedentota bacterium]